MSDEWAAPTIERYREIADDLHLLGRTGRQFKVAAAPAVTARTSSIFGAARHAVEAAKTAVDMFAGGQELLSQTLIRSALECSVTAAWLAGNPEAIYVVLAENLRQRVILSKKMAEAASEVLREGSSRIAHIDDDKVPTTSESAGRNVEARCRDLQGGNELYIHYKVLSTMVHPGADLFDFYLERDDQLPSGCRLLMDPHPLGHLSWVYIGVVSMIWAHSAMDDINLSHPHRKHLAALAAELQIAPRLELSIEARQAAWAAQRQRTNARWAAGRRRSRGASVLRPRGLIRSAAWSGVGGPFR